MKTKLKAAMFATLWTLVVALAAGIATNWKESPATGVEILLWGGMYAADSSLLAPSCSVVVTPSATAESR